MKNPNKYIRASIVSALATATGLSVFDSGIPIDLQPLPEKYLIVNTQSKSRFAVTKGNHEWLCSVTLDLNAVQEKGFNSTVEVDNMEEQVLTAMPGIAVSGFRVNFTRLVDSVPLPIETATATINRTVLVYEQWLNKAI